MTGTEFSVDLEHLDDVVARLSNLVSFLTEQLDQIDDHVAALQGGSWGSVAAQAYADAHRQWSSGARELVEGVHDMHDAAKAAHERYTAAFDTNYKMFSGG